MNVNAVQSINGEIWLATTRGAYVVQPSGPRLVSSIDLDVRDAVGYKGQVWLATDKGAYLFERGSLRRNPDVDLDVTRIDIIRDEVWLITDMGAYVIVNNVPQRVTKSGTFVSSIQQVGSEIWLAAAEGACRVEGHQAHCIDIQIPIPEGLQSVSVNDIKRINGKIFLATDEGLYRLEGEQPRRISPLKLNITKILESNGQIWLATDRGAYRFDGARAIRIPDREVNVNDIQDIKGELWLATDVGAFIVEKGEPHRKPDSEVKITSISEISGKIWLATEKGAYRIDGTQTQRIPDVDLNVSRVTLINGNIWLATDNGAYRFDESQQISLDLKPADSTFIWAAQAFLPRDVMIGGLALPVPRYTDQNRDGYDNHNLEQYFEVIWETDQEKFKSDVGNRRYNAAERAYLPLATGKHTVFYSVRDKWGNTFSGQTQVRVIPGPAVLSLAGIILWIALLFIVFVLSPRSSFFHGLIMNPYARRYGSFGLVPLFVTAVPPLRRHLLRRYLRGIRTDQTIMQWQRRFVVPTEDFAPGVFADFLNRRRTLFLAGQSGIGKTSYFRFLMGYMVLRRRWFVSKTMVPVFLALSRYEGAQPEDMFNAELSNFGQLTDTHLNSWLLQQGGFLIFIDGLNEASDAARQSVSRFINQHWKANLFCISSQQSYAEFEWMEKLQLVSLSPDKVNQVLTLRLGEQQASATIAQFTPTTYEICAIPQDLEFAIDLVKCGHPLPQSKRDIYQATLKPIFDSWEASGQGMFKTFLFGRAFEMLCSGEAFFERSEKPMPDEIREALSTQKLIVRRGDHYHFRHDLVRGYLAAHHFVPSWQRTLKDSNITIDTNWRAMLEFAILDIAEPVEVGKLISLTLERNTKLAGDLFKWLEHSQLSLMSTWADHFKREYGEAMLRQ